jgi:hypothetical protein
MNLLASLEAGAPLSTRIRTLAVAPDFGGKTERAATARQLRSLLGAPVWFDLGAWTETARLAVAARDVSFFQAGSRGLIEGGRILRHEVPPADRAEWVTAVGPLRALLDSKSWSANDLDSLGRAIHQAMVVAAR